MNPPVLWDLFTKNNKQYSFCAEFREVFKNEIEKNIRALESGFLRTKRALCRFFWSISVYFLFQSWLGAPTVSKTLVMPPNLIVIQSAVIPVYFRWFLLDFRFSERTYNTYGIVEAHFGPTEQRIGPLTRTSVTGRHDWHLRTRLTIFGDDGCSGIGWFWASKRTGLSEMCVFHVFWVWQVYEGVLA